YEEVCRKKGGFCLVTDYVNRWDSLEWHCKEDHKWKASAKDILKGTWCQKCNTPGRKCVVSNQKIIPVQGHITSEQE
ncbi:6816_t:CDS:1, partial [Funneliformis mosseae]